MEQPTWPTKFRIINKPHQNQRHFGSQFPKRKKPLISGKNFNWIYWQLSIWKIGLWTFFSPAIATQKVIAWSWIRSCCYSIRKKLLGTNKKLFQHKFENREYFCEGKTPGKFWRKLRNFIFFELRCGGQGSVS